MCALGLRFSTGKGLAALLQSVGLAISEREIQRLLPEKQDDFLDETRDARRAGLRASVNDTSPRHKAENGYCTQIGNEHFTPAFAGAGSGSARGHRRAG